MYQVCYARYQVSFYLWWFRPKLNYQKVPKYYDQDCRYRNKTKPLEKELQRTNQSYNFLKGRFNNRSMKNTIQFQRERESQYNKR